LRSFLSATGSSMRGSRRRTAVAFLNVAASRRRQPRR
jgi:hypothetical protein